MSEDKDKLWLEDEIQREVLLSAEEQDIPESLLPEHMVARLKEKQKISRKKRSKYIFRITEMAAAIALVIAIGGIGNNMIQSNKASGSNDAAAMDSAMSTEDVKNSTDAMDMEVVEATEENVSARIQDSISESQKELEGYHVASGYGEIYDLINESKKEMFKYSMGALDAIISDAAVDDLAVAESAEQSIEHSSTNVQQEGVDESDLVKTDGKYIYRVKNNTIEIIDIRNKKMEKVGTIRPELGPCDTVEELYMDDNQLFVIVSRMESELRDVAIVEDSYYWDNSINSCTELLTYDITNPFDVKLSNIFSQDGGYFTSRKVGDFIYMFTRNDIYRTIYEDVKDAIPYVQNKRVQCEDIYIGSQVYAELIIASVNTTNPSESVDEKVILDDYSEIYVGNSSIYLYQYVYRDGGEMTQIAKFSYEDGMMQPVASALVRGMITDTFAISEKNGYLRVLTSDWLNGDRKNQLYMLDENLNVSGQIDNIAEGESVYAARYIGDTAYFITYRNMDPLFVADLSDPHNPMLLGSVEVTGFSDYLHLYQDDLVLGIGYETDEDSSRLGVKLCMFDVSNPLLPEVKNTLVLEDADSVTADYDYKAVIVDGQKGLIGFVTESWGDKYTSDYHLFTWNGEAFEEILSEPLTHENKYDYEALRARALYVGDVFYLVKKNSIKSFDMTSEFALLEEL